MNQEIAELLLVFFDANRLFLMSIDRSQQAHQLVLEASSNTELLSRVQKCLAETNLKNARIVLGLPDAWCFFFPGRRTGSSIYELEEFLPYDVDECDVFHLPTATDVQAVLWCAPWQGLDTYLKTRHPRAVSITPWTLCSLSHHLKANNQSSSLHVAIETVHRKHHLTLSPTGLKSWEVLPAGTNLERHAIAGNNAQAPDLTSVTIRSRLLQVSASEDSPKQQDVILSSLFDLYDLVQAQLAESNTNSSPPAAPNGKDNEQQPAVIVSAPENAQLNAELGELLQSDLSSILDLTTCRGSRFYRAGRLDMRRVTLVWLVGSILILAAVSFTVRAVRNYQQAALDRAEQERIWSELFPETTIPYDIKSTLEALLRQKKLDATVLEKFRADQHNLRMLTDALRLIPVTAEVQLDSVSLETGTVRLSFSQLIPASSTEYTAALTQLGYDVTTEKQGAAGVNVTVRAKPSTPLSEPAK